MQKKILLVSILCSMNLSAAELEKLDDVVVTATRSQVSTNDAPGSVTVINRKEIEQKGSSNLLDIIRATAGINIRGVGSGGRKSINLRGLESKHVLILIDGKRVPSSNDIIGPNTDYQYDWIPISRIERVEVVRGPMSVLYGADALGGVINIITQKPSKKIQGSVKYGHYFSNGDSSNDGDGYNTNANINGHLHNKIGFNLDLRKSKRDSVDSKIKSGQSAIEGHENEQFSLGLSYKLNQNHAITLDYNNGNENRWLDTATRRKKRYQSRYDIDKDLLSLAWKGTYGDKKVSLRAYNSKVKVTNKATNGVKATAPQELKDKTLEGSFLFPVGDKQFITAGFEHRKEKLINSRLKQGEDEVTFKSIYVQDEIDLTDNLLFTLGARMDDHSVFGNETSPRASVVWNINDKLAFKASYGHGFKAPNIKQASEDYIFRLGTIKVTGNNKLKPETNNAFEVGANYHTDRYSLDATLFDNKVKNLIELTGPITDRSYKNVSEARLKGLELASAINLTQKLQLKTSYQYLDAKDGDGNALKHRPKHSVSSSLSWDLKQWKLNLGAEYVSKQVIEHNRVSSNVPGYTLWNATMSKKINKHLEVSAGIDNLTDIRLEDKSPAFLHEEYPRTVRLELRANF